MSISYAIEDESADLKGLTIIDDDDEVREVLRSDFEGQGLAVHLVTHSYGNDIPGLITEIERNRHPVLCDLRLNFKGNYVSSTGAEIVARLYDRKIPAVLTTQYANASSIRIGAYRRKIPSFVDRDNLGTVEQLAHQVSLCAKEFLGEFSSERRPHRTLVRVEEISHAGPTNKQTFFAVVPSWNPHKKVEIPYENISPIIDSVKVGTRLIGDVNIGAATADELYFDKLSVASLPKDL